MFLYIKSHVTRVGTKVSNTQRLIPLSRVQYIDYDPDHNSLKVKLIGQLDEDVYAAENEHDRANTKRVFYDILKDIRANTKVIEW